MSRPERSPERSDARRAARRDGSRPPRWWLVAVAALLLAPACRQDMHDQAKIEPFERSRFFENGLAAKGPVENTVARGSLVDRPVFSTGLEAPNKWTSELPVELDRALLDRGRERFDIFCSPCHDRTGSGRGMIVQRGFDEPPSYHEARLREMPVGYFVDIMTRGLGAMPSYAAQVAPRDRWAIAAYIRALQLSQRFPVEALSARERAALEETGSSEGDAG